MTASHILLTGGTGFFGKSLLRHWAELEQKGEQIAQVTLLSRNPKQFAVQHPELVAHNWLNLVQGDVCLFHSLPRAKNFTHVIHAASDSTAGPRLTPQQRFDQIVTGTRNVLDLALASGVSRFLFTSSGGVYGPQPKELERIPEDYLGMPDPLDPANSYSIAKRCAEHLCALYFDHYGLETVIARCFTFVGQDLPLDAHFAIGNFIRDAIDASEITLNGDGTPIRSYMDQRDLAIWLCALLVSGKAGEAYNVGSDQALTIAELANRVRDLLAPSKKLKFISSEVKKSFRNFYVPSIEKVYIELGLSLRYSLNDAILYAAENNRNFEK